MSDIYMKFDPELDLTFDRIVDVKPELVWAAWTQPKHIVHWFTPDPWKTIACEIDLRPGGIFSTTMQSPEGGLFPNAGCFLEIVENKRLVWTAALGPGFRPQPTYAADGMPFTGVIEIEPAGEGTKYTATAIHGNPEDSKRHAEMGFEQGWGKALEQLVNYMKTA